MEPSTRKSISTLPQGMRIFDRIVDDVEDEFPQTKFVSRTVAG